MTVTGPGAGALPTGAGGVGGAGLPPPPSIVGGQIVDQAFNPLIQPTTGEMLGYVEAIEPEEALALQIYFFIIETIRIEDANNGGYFLKRYLEGPQAVWGQLRQNIFKIKDLWSIVDCPAEFLPYLKNIVGWTDKLNYITDSLDSDTLRRLIGNSVNFWKTRGPQSTTTNILGLVTGARVRLWDWFDFRWVSDEVDLGHESDGYDPWIISIDNNQEYNVRIMDDGTLDRDLVVNLIKLTRPAGERVELTYLLLLDLFDIDDDDSQWNALDENGDSGSDVVTVFSGSAIMDDDTIWQEIYSNINDTSEWDEFVFSARIRGSYKFGLTFHRADEDNYYMYRLNTSGVADNFELVRRLDGTNTVLATTPAPPDFLVDSSVYYMFRVQVGATLAGNEILCFVDGREMINVIDPTFTNGSLGIIHEVGGTVEVDEVEVMRLPAETDFIDINS